MEQSINPEMEKNHSVVMDENGVIYGVIEFTDTQELNDLVKQIVLDNNDEYSKVRFVDPVTLASSDETNVLIALDNEKNNELEFEISITPTSIYTRKSLAHITA